MPSKSCSNKIDTEEEPHAHVMANIDLERNEMVEHDRESNFKSRSEVVLDIVKDVMDKSVQSTKLMANKDSSCSKSDTLIFSKHDAGHSETPHYSSVQSHPDEHQHNQSDDNVQESFLVSNFTLFVYREAKKGSILSFHKHRIMTKPKRHLVSIRVRCRKFKSILGHCRIGYTARLRSDGKGWDVSRAKVKEHSHELELFQEEDVAKKQWMKCTNLIFSRINGSLNEMRRSGLGLYDTVLSQVQDEFQKAFAPIDGKSL